MRTQRRNKLLKRRLNRSWGGTLALFFLLTLFALFMGLPLIVVVNRAFMPLDEIFIFPPRFIVRRPTLVNFSDMVTVMASSWVPFSRYILNSVIIVGIGTAGHLLIASMAAYPLAKINLPGKNLLFSMVVLSLMFSGAVTAIPGYMIVTWLGINNTHAAIIIPFFCYSLGLYLMKQFMEQLPDSLIESARLDGASEYMVFFRIVMPNVKPAWLTLIIFAFGSLWGNTGGQFLRSEQLKPLAAAFQTLQAGGIARIGAFSAVSLVNMLVPITIFIISQSNILQTMATSGMKE